MLVVLVAAAAAVPVGLPNESCLDLVVVDVIVVLVVLLPLLLLNVAPCLTIVIPSVVTWMTCQL